MKKTIALTLAIGMISATTVFAEYNPDKVVDPNAEFVTTSLTLGEPDLIVGGNAVEVKPMVLDNEVMVPLRALAEGLGYEVLWDGDTQMVTLVRGAHYITLFPDRDEYTFARMAPMPLGTAPKIIDDRTFVPAKFISDILQTEYNVDEGGNIVVAYESPLEAVSLKGTIKEVDEYFVLIDVDDNDMDTALIVTEETSIRHIRNKRMYYRDDLQPGMNVEVLHSPAMTFSIPPQTVAFEIVLVD